MYKNYVCNPPLGICPPYQYLDGSGMDCLPIMEQPLAPMESYLPEMEMNSYPQIGEIYPPATYPGPFMPAIEMMACPYMPCLPMPCPPMPPQDNVAQICESVYQKVSEIEEKIDKMQPKIEDMHEKINDIYQHMHGKR